MKKNCVLCKKSISHLDMPLELIDDQILCRDCAGDIVYDISKIYKNMPEDEFNQLKEKIIKLCQNRFTQDIIGIVIATVNDKYGLVDKEEIKRRNIEQNRLNQERIQLKIDNLNKMGLDGYYEYKVVSLNDDNAGGIYSSTIEDTLNQLGLEGWHLKCAYTNELGKNSNSGGIGGFSAGTNSTIDQNILIFERFVRINKE